MGVIVVRYCSLSAPLMIILPNVIAPIVLGKQPSITGFLRRILRLSQRLLFQLSIGLVLVWLNMSFVDAVGCMYIATQEQRPVK